MKIQTSIRVEDDDLMKAQELAMSRTWDNDEDKAWDEL